MRLHPRNSSQPAETGPAHPPWAPESRRRDHPGIAVWEGSVDTETLQGRRGRCVQPWLRTAVTLRATLLLKLLAVTPSELLNWEANADDGEPASQLCLQGL